MQAAAAVEALVWAMCEHPLLALPIVLFASYTVYWFAVYEARPLHALSVALSVARVALLPC